jgi:hypothetical protein
LHSPTRLASRSTLQAIAHHDHMLMASKRIDVTLLPPIKFGPDSPGCCEPVEVAHQETR